MRDTARWLMTFAVFLFATTPAGATCSRPNYDLIYCEPLSTMDTTCWTYSGNADWINSGSCYPAARFTGGGAGDVYQDTDANLPGYNFSAQYTIDINDPHHSYNDEIEIDVLDASNSQWLANIAIHSGGDGDISCHTYNVDLGYHPSWSGKTLRVEIYSYQTYSNVTFKVGGVHLWQLTG